MHTYGRSYTLRIVPYNYCCKETEREREGEDTYVRTVTSSSLYILLLEYLHPSRGRQLQHELSLALVTVHGPELEYPLPVVPDARLLGGEVKPNHRDDALGIMLQTIHQSRYPRAREPVREPVLLP